MEQFNFNDRPSKQRIEMMTKEHYEIKADLVLTFIDFQWTYRNMQERYDTLLEKYNLSESKFIILMFLKHTENHCLLPSEIAQKLGARRPTVSKLLTGMLKQGLVEKSDNHEDKRSSFIQLTDKGKETLDDFLPHHFAAVQTVLNNFSPLELEQFNQLLAKINLASQEI